MYSLELETQRVWDYSGDGYVHRLIQSNTDGKLIQLPAVNPNPSPHIFRLGLDSLTDAPLVTQNDGIVSEKVEMIGIDYANLLNQQLARQQEWFEHQLSKIEALNCEQISILIGENEHNRNNYLMLKHQIAALEGETKQKDAKIEKLTKKLVECNQQISELDSDLSEEKTMNNGMVENQKYLQGKIKELEDGVCQKDNEMEELKDQLRDLMFFLDTQSKVADNEELKEAVVVGVSTKESPKKGGRKKR
jgi:BRCA1-associated protein